MSVGVGSDGTEKAARLKTYLLQNGRREAQLVDLGDGGLYELAKRAAAQLEGYSIAAAVLITESGADAAVFANRLPGVRCVPALNE